MVTVIFMGSHPDRGISRLLEMLPNMGRGFGVRNDRETSTRESYYTSIKIGAVLPT